MNTANHYSPQMVSVRADVNRAIAAALAAVSTSNPAYAGWSALQLQAERMEQTAAAVVSTCDARGVTLEAAGYSPALRSQVAHLVGAA